MTAGLDLAAFQQHLHTRFRCEAGGAVLVELELIEAVDSGSSPKAERFSLLFRGPLATPLEQATYPMEHDVLGQLAIFIVPIEREAEGFVYEAVFNRLRQP